MQPYIASWLEVLKDDPRAHLHRCEQGAQAADSMHAQQPQTEEIAA